ncbi:MAG: VWA domain-containing protein [Treponema sp.]|nr:VWA domain-containing protein [Treponema sp.]
MNAALSFTAPWALAGFVLFIPLAVFGLLRYGALKDRFRAAGLGGRASLGRRYMYSGVFFGLFLACLIIALAGPQWGSRIVMEYRRGLDVVFALDLSRSMDIRDVPGTGKTPGTGTRLERGLRIARDAAAASGGVRFAAALGKGKGLLAVPLTGDTGTILGFLEGLSESSLTGGGTNLEALVDAASSAFTVPFPSRRLIVLVSDGEALSGSLKGALERLREAGIAVTALGLGSDEGAPVPGDTDEAGAAGQIISRRQADVLQYAAGRTGGIYIDGNNGEAAALLAEHFRSLAPESGVRSGRREPKPRWDLFVIAAMLAFGASKLCMMKGRGKALSVILLILFCSCSRVTGKLLMVEGNFFVSRGMYTEAASSYLRALEHDEAAPYAEYGLGSVYFSLDEGKVALERYGASEKLLETVSLDEHRELRYRIPYNAGLVFFGEGDYAAAAAAFRAALEIDGRRIDAKRNLELSLLSLAREQAGAGRTGTDRTPGEAEAVLFDYLRRKEQNQWRSREWIEEDTPGPDY